MEVQVLSRAPMENQSLFKKGELFYEKYERHLSSLALVAGFIFDNLTLQRIDLLFENVSILSYLVFSGGSIVLLNYYKEFPPLRKMTLKIQSFLPFLIQFAFGGLFSAFFIFYTRSAALSSSWPFMLVLLFLLIGNEFFKEYYQKIAFQTSIYFVAVFSFFIFFVPVILKTMGALVFVLSGIVSVFVIYLFTRLLSKVVPRSYLESKMALRNSLLSIFVVINILYFTNLIPPIPLALKSSGVYYAVERVAESYQVIGEEKAWYESLPFFSSKKISWRSGMPLYVFSSVFAPTNLNTKIIHDWQYRDQAAGKWVSTSKITFPIRGGRGGGYRGFSTKSSLFIGEWRVDVKTGRGQVIGRVRFDIEPAPSKIELIDEVL
jgi:hypothetical protein